jgi:hypothetical protein
MTNGPLEKTFLPFKTSSLVFPANDKNINLLLQLTINKNKCRVLFSHQIGSFNKAWVGVNIMPLACKFDLGW